MTGRDAAWRALAQVLGRGRSLSGEAGTWLDRPGDPRERSLARELCYGTLRWLPRLEAICARLMRRPLKRRDVDVQAALLLGLYQLLFTRIPAHAAVAESVRLAKGARPWAGGLVNGVLRNFQRDRDTLLSAVLEEPAARWAHPRWLLDAITEAWPEDWERVLEAGNTRAPMVLRVNERRIGRADYRALLAAEGIEARDSETGPQAVVLTTPCDVERLPGFESGLVSVQDAAAQLACGLLDVDPGNRVLDACAAPGGKTAHLLEQHPDMDGLLAVDAEAHRLSRLERTLERLGLGCDTRAADAVRTDEWWDGQPFQRILLDAPCSATGVLRRHPDIKVLRRPGDLPSLATAQRALLDALWPLLAPGGLLLYATCSILPAENEQQLRYFLDRHPDASELPIVAGWGAARPHGRQVLPGDQDMDGFYYARLVKGR